MPGRTSQVAALHLIQPDLHTMSSLIYIYIFNNIIYIYVYILYLNDIYIYHMCIKYPVIILANIIILVSVRGFQRWDHCNGSWKGF